MKRCPKCKIIHEDHVLTCDCGADLQSIAAEESRKQVSTKAESSYGREGSYHALQAIGTVYHFLGWLIIAGGILGGLLTGLQAVQFGGVIAGLMSSAAMVLGSAVIALPLLAFQDVIRWMIDVRTLLSRLA
jgi:predicted lipid-binding transport protein (Tim44 family)